MFAAATEEQRRRRKGLLIAIAGAASVALNFITAKYAMQAMNSLTFVTLWFVCAWPYASLYLLARRVDFTLPLRAHWKPLLGIGLLHCLTVVTGFTGLRLLDPTVTSFFSRSEVLFTALLGFVVLRERPGLDAWLGMALSLTGIAVLTYATGSAQRLGVLLCLISAASAAMGYMMGKYVASVSNPVVTVWYRSVVIATVVGIITVSTGHFSVPASWRHLAVLAFGAFVGPFGAQVLFFLSLRYISLSEVGVVRATSPLFVAVYAPLLLRMFPTPKQLIGGLIVVAGLILLAMAQPVVENRSHPPEQAT